MLKNCGDFVHSHIAEKHLLEDMVKIVKKKVIFIIMILLTSPTILYLVYYIILINCVCERVILKYATKY